MQNKYIFYFHDNKLQYTKKDEIKTYTFSFNSLMYGKIINIGLFIKELKTFIKKEKIGFLFSPLIKFIYSSPFYNADKELFIMAFNSVGINKLEFISEYSLYPKKKNAIFLNILDTYLVKTICKDNSIKSLLYPFNLFKDKKELINIACNSKDDSYLLFGSNENILEFVDIFKRKSYDNVHYYNNYKTYLIEKCLSVKNWLNVDSFFIS